MPKSGIRIFHYVTNKISSSSEKDTTPQQAKLYVVRKLGKVAKKRSLDTNFPLFGGAKLQPFRRDRGTRHIAPSATPNPANSEGVGEKVGGTKN